MGLTRGMSDLLLVTVVISADGNAILVQVAAESGGHLAGTDKSDLHRILQFYSGV